MSFKRKTGIILALDTKDRAKAFGVLEECNNYVDIIKFNYPLILKEGLSLISEIKKKYKKPIIADFKIADVPVTNNRIAKIVFDAGADAIMVHGFIGEDALYSLLEIASKKRKKIIVVTELTHDGGLDYSNHFALQFARMAKGLETFGIQAPGTRPKRVKQMRKIVGNGLCIVSCGVGVQGGKFGEAIKAGATFEIIGRSIYMAHSPRKAIKRIAKEIRRLNPEAILW